MNNPEVRQAVQERYGAIARGEAATGPVVVLPRVDARIPSRRICIRMPRRPVYPLKRWLCRWVVETPLLSPTWNLARSFWISVPAVASTSCSPQKGSGPPARCMDST